MSNKMEEAIASVVSQLSLEQRASLLNCHFFDELIAVSIVSFEADSLPRDFRVANDPVGYALSYLRSYVYG